MNIFILAFIFLVSPLCGMESLTQDIVLYRIQPYLSFQDIGCVKQISRKCNTLYDPDNNFEYSLYACFRLKRNYYACTQALVYCAKKDDEEKFKNLWKYHESIRNGHVDDVMDGYQYKYTMQELMRLYRKFDKKKKIYQHILDEGKKWLRSAAKDFNSNKLENARILFSCIDGWMLYDLLINAGYKKESWPLSCFAYDIFDYTCQLNNVDLIVLLCGGSVTQWSFRYIAMLAPPHLLIKLLCKDILPSKIIDNAGKSLLHYAAEQGYPRVIEAALKKGAYVNCCDDEGMTPLHYATQYRKKEVVIVLMKDDNINVSHVDDSGKTAFDYVKKNMGDKSPIKKEKKEIRVTLRPYIETARINKQINKQLIKAHRNGYQKLQ